MKLWAISDLHVNHDANRRALDDVPVCNDDWLIIAGDIGDSQRHFEMAFDRLVGRFRRLIWVPGNHDLWTTPACSLGLRGEAKYQRLVELCRAYGVVTPEDDYPVFESKKQNWLVAPLFTLYDYSFRPDDVSENRVLEWAAETNIQCADERFLYSDPYPTRSAWCEARCETTEQRLTEAAGDLPLVMVNHYPMHRRLAVLPRIPRFTPWCGTRRTEDWPARFGAEIVVFGHLHIRQSCVLHDVRHEEVSLGYPKQWDQGKPITSYMRQILPVAD